MVHLFSTYIGAPQHPISLCKLLSTTGFSFSRRTSCLFCSVLQQTKSNLLICLSMDRFSLSSGCHELSFKKTTSLIACGQVAVQPPRDHHCHWLLSFLATWLTPPLGTLTLCLSIWWWSSAFILPSLYFLTKWKSANSPTHLCPTAFNLAVLRT